MSLRFLFPSPMGIMSVSIQMSKVIEGAASKVSVPYGDHVCLNLKAAKYGLHVRVSVPYGDHVCLNDLRKENNNVGGGLFPSPMGIMSVSIQRS